MVAMVCAGLLLSQISLAAPPAPYGEYFVRLGETWPDGGVPAPRELGATGATDSADYQHQLDLLEEEGGPYADTLAEPLAGLARVHRLNGDVAQAQQAYRRALHVVRINEGLYSKGQVPLLKELFDTYRMTGDMEILDSRYDYFFRLYGSGQPPYTPVRIGAALEYLRWQREALRLGLDELETRRLLAMYALNERILDAVSDDPSVGFLNYRALVLSQLRNLYLIRERYDTAAETVVPGSRVGMPDAFDEKSASQHRLEILQRGALTRGRVLLEGLTARAQPGQPEELARAWLELADWNQWNDRGDDALAAYAEVTRVLRQAGRAELLRQWFGGAVELPANGAFWQPQQVIGGESPVVVRARYDVSASGRARDIEVTVMANEHEGKARRVKRKLAQTRFRPRFINGEPEPEPQVLRDYEVLN